jgi:hypothetical protein
VDGGFVSEARFVAPAAGTYLVGFRDTSVAPGEALPAFVRPIVTIDDLATKRIPSACASVKD